MSLYRLVPFMLASLVAGLSANSASAQSCVAASPGLVAWWPGDGNAYDVIGSNNGLLQGAAAYGTGEVNQAFSFPQNPSPSAYVSVPASPSLSPAAITVEAWIYRTAAVGLYDPIVKNNANDSSGYSLEFFGQNMSFWVYLQNIGWAGATSSGSSITVPLSQWTHLAGTYDGTAIRLYINGVLVGTSAISGAIAPSTTGFLNIAHDQVNGGRFFNGLIDEVKIYNRGLSASEIAAVYNAGSAGTCKPQAHVCALYDATKAVKSGATFPVKLELCDFTGTDLSSSSVALHATRITPASSSISGDVQDSGSANADGDFRFDSTLGTTGGYIFNLSTFGLPTGTYNLNFTVSGDTFVYGVPFQVK